MTPPPVPFNTTQPPIPSRTTPLASTSKTAPPIPTVTYSTILFEPSDESPTRPAITDAEVLIQLSELGGINFNEIKRASRETIDPAQGTYSFRERMGMAPDIVLHNGNKVIPTELLTSTALRTHITKRESIQANLEQRTRTAENKERKANRKAGVVFSVALTAATLLGAGTAGMYYWHKGAQETLNGIIPVTELHTQKGKMLAAMVPNDGKYKMILTTPGESIEPGEAKFNLSFSNLMNSARANPEIMEQWIGHWGTRLATWNTEYSDLEEGMHSLTENGEHAIDLFGGLQGIFARTYQDASNMNVEINTMEQGVKNLDTRIEEGRGDVAKRQEQIISIRAELQEGIKGFNELTGNYKTFKRWWSGYTAKGRAFTKVAHDARKLRKDLETLQDDAPYLADLTGGLVVFYQSLRSEHDTMTEDVEALAHKKRVFDKANSLQARARVKYLLSLEPRTVNANQLHNAVGEMIEQGCTAGSYTPSLKYGTCQDGAFVGKKSDSCEGLLVEAAKGWKLDQGLRGPRPKRVRINSKAALARFVTYERARCHDEKGVDLVRVASSANDGSPYLLR